MTPSANSTLQGPKGDTGAAPLLGYIKVTDTKAANTAGGTATSGSYQTRTLNTEDSDTNNDCSLSSNRITLTAGTYICRITAPAIFVNGHKARLQNVTDGTTVLLGTAEYNDSATGVVQTVSVVSGPFTIAASKQLEVQHRVASTRASNGLGVAANFGDSEIYTVAEFWRIA